MRACARQGIVFLVMLISIAGVPACEPVSKSNPNEIDVFPDGLSSITVVVRDGLAYPIFQFRCSGVEEEQGADDSCPAGSGCDGQHYHGTAVTIGRVAPIGASDVDSNTVDVTDDPDMCHCGWGKVEELDIRTLQVFVVDVDLFFDRLPSTSADANDKADDLENLGLTRAEILSSDPCGG